MFDPLGIGAGRVFRDADGAQHRHDQMMPRAGPFRHGLPGLGEKDAAIGTPGRQPRPFEPGDRLDGRGMGDTEAAGDIRHPRLAMGGDEIGDEFRIILEQNAGAGRARLTEAARLGGRGEAALNHDAAPV